MNDVTALNEIFNYKWWNSYWRVQWLFSVPLSSTAWKWDWWKPRYVFRQWVGITHEGKRDSTTLQRMHEDYCTFPLPPYVLLTLPFCTAQGQVQHDMQSYSNQSVKLLIKMMTWDHRDCSSGSLCTELVTSFPIWLKVSLRGYWHFYISRLMDGRELLNLHRPWM